MQYDDDSVTLAKLFNHEVLPRPELHALLVEYRSLADEHGAESAQALKIRNRIMTSNMRLVSMVAKRFTIPRGMSHSDLVQQGVPGLVLAVERFDASRGCAFSTYATWWIRHCIRRALDDTANPVRIPVHALDAKPGTPAGDNAAAARRMCSLDAPSSQGDDARPWAEYLEAEGDDALESALHAEATERVRAALEALPPKLRQVVELRFWQDKTLKDVGESRGMSREWTRVLEAEALNLLRVQLREHGAS